MGTYVAVRGWLECDERQLAAIQTIIAAHDDSGYSHGWGTPRKQAWTHYLFYGTDMREAELDGFLAHLREIAAVPASDADGDRAVGLIFASHEVAGMSEWQIRDGQVTITPGDERYRYLDA